MTTLEEYRKIGEDLERILLLRTAPLAVKMLKSESDIPQGAIRPKRDRQQHLAQCQAFALSRRQKLTVAMLKEDNWCWGPLVAYGLVDPAIARDYPEIRQQTRILPRLEFGQNIGIVTAPLRTTSFLPDMILMYSNPAQLRSLLETMKYSGEPLIKSVFDPIDSCAYSVIPALYGEFRITLPDPGEYERALASEDEIIFSIPADKAQFVSQCLQKHEDRKSVYRGSFMEMLPDFPQPEFYQKLFKQCNLD